MAAIRSWGKGTEVEDHSARGRFIGKAIGGLLEGHWKVIGRSLGGHLKVIWGPLDGRWKVGSSFSKIRKCEGSCVNYERLEHERVPPPRCRDPHFLAPGH